MDKAMKYIKTIVEDFEEGKIYGKKMFLALRNSVHS